MVNDLIEIMSPLQNPAEASGEHVLRIGGVFPGHSRSVCVTYASPARDTRWLHENA
jgi:hypothetical protein